MRRAAVKKGGIEFEQFALLLRASSGGRSASSKTTEWAVGLAALLAHRERQGLVGTVAGTETQALRVMAEVV
jgi:hypothetical protein